LRVKEEMLRTNPPYSERTIRTYMKDLVFLDKQIDLNNVETVIEFIRTRNVGEMRKRNLFNSYRVYRKIFGLRQPERVLHGGLRKSYSKIPEIPSEQVLDRVIEQANLYYSIVFDFLKNSGVLTIELINLRIEDLNENILTVRTAKQAGMATRQLKISDRLLEKLHRHIIIDRTTGYLFERHGKPLNEHRLRKKMIFYREKAANKLNLPDAKKVHLHIFRHFFASKLYQESKDLVLVKTLLGHTNIKSTEIYTHIIKFLDNRFEAKAIPVKNTEEICKMLSEGWNVVTTTSENVFVRRNIY
jgi:integrase